MSYLRTYRAPTVAEALAEVKQDLGRDAVILHTRSFRKGGLLGLIGGRMTWEIVASPNTGGPREARGGQYVSDAEAVASGSPVPVAPDPPSAAAAPQQALAPDDATHREIREIRSMLQRALAGQTPGRDSHLPAELESFLAHLHEQEVGEPIVDELMDQLQMELTGKELGDRDRVAERLEALIARRIKATGLQAQEAVGRPRIIVMIGPTGVGKTTTIAKLAANYKLRLGKRIGLITIDTYRIAAVEQLRTYAHIIEVPVRVVLTTGELQQAIRSMADHDVILIDTAGRSPNNRMRLSQLRGFIAAAAPDEVHLVVSAGAGRRSMLCAVERFLPLGANRVVVSKMDEAETFGGVLNIAAACTGTPLSYVTTGQDVPDDLALADARMLARWVMSGTMGGVPHVC